MFPLENMCPKMETNSHFGRPGKARHGREGSEREIGRDSAGDRNVQRAERQNVPRAAAAGGGAGLSFSNALDTQH